MLQLCRTGTAKTPNITTLMLPLLLLVTWPRCHSTGGHQVQFCGQQNTLQGAKAFHMGKVTKHPFPLPQRQLRQPQPLAKLRQGAARMTSSNRQNPTPRHGQRGERAAGQLPLARSQRLQRLRNRRACAARWPPSTQPNHMCLRHASASAAWGARRTSGLTCRGGRAGPTVCQLVK